MIMNYDAMMEDIISKLDYVPKILLHSCCAPCSSATIERLKDYFDITVLYYNPNIEPESEYIKRKNEQKRFLNEIESKNKIDFLDVDYDNTVFRNLARGHEEDPERGARCYLCYKERLEYTFKKARELGFDYFGTTLSISPYKVSSWINEIGLELEDDKVKFLPADFKKKNGYKRSIELASEYGLYRQDYCGCKYSKKEHEAYKLRKNLVFDRLKSSELEEVKKLYDNERPNETNFGLMKESFKKLENNPDYIFVTAKINDEIVGFIEVHIHHDIFEECKDYMSLWALRVKESYRRMGIATEMIKYVEALSHEMNCDFITLLSEPDNDGANALYRKLGYEFINGWLKK